MRGYIVTLGSLGNWLCPLWQVQRVLLGGQQVGMSDIGQFLTFYEQPPVLDQLVWPVESMVPVPNRETYS
jgi:hypothetical protein